MLIWALLQSLLRLRAGLVISAGEEVSEGASAQHPGRRDIERAEALKLCKVVDRSLWIAHPDPRRESPRKFRLGLMLQHHRSKIIPRASRRNDPRGLLRVLVVRNVRFHTARVTLWASFISASPAAWRPREHTQ